MKSERDLNHLPQKSRSIPAPFFEKFIFSLLYFCVIFFILFQFLFSFIHVAFVLPEEKPLLLYPHSYETHLNYLEILIDENRVDEAFSELTYIQRAEKNFALSSSLVTRREALVGRLLSSQMTFKTYLDDYVYWNGVVDNHPNYRDGEYMLALSAYRLFNDSDARRHLTISSSLDPYFVNAVTALEAIKKAP